ncbi:MAG: DUF975 family protein [Oscillospiraceae bacterium]
MFLAGIISLVSELFFILSSFFNLFCIYSLVFNGEQIINIYITIAFYFLFVFGFLFSLFFTFQISFNRKIWFFRTIKSPQKLRSLFSIMNLKYRFKICLLILCKNSLCILKSILMILPSLIGIAFLTYMLKNGGVYKNLFEISSLFLALSLVFSLGFIFAQKHSYCLTEIIFCCNKDMKIRNVLKSSKQISNGFEFKLSAFKLSFLPWFFLSILIFPLFFVMPYYFEAVAISNDMVLKKISNEALNSKPIVFIFPSKSDSTLQKAH